MRIVLPVISLAVVMAAFGCQKQPTNNANGPPDASPATVALTEPIEESLVEAETTNDAGTQEAEGHAHGGRGRMGRRGGGPGMMGGNREDMTTLHAMFADRDKIKRTVKNLPNGAEATTESDDEQIASLIQEHVPAMEGRVMENNPLPPMTFHPIFVALIKHSDDYTLTYEETDQGVKVNYQSDDPYVVMLVQEHANLVSRFIQNGMEEIHKPYTLPRLDEQTELSAADSTPGSFPKTTIPQPIQTEGQR